MYNYNSRMSSVTTSQSTTNWRAVKQLYLQGVKMPSSPQPAHEDSTSRQVQEYASLILAEMEKLHRQSLADLQEKNEQAMLILSQRIDSLEEEVRTLRKEKKKQSQSAHGWNSANCLPSSQADGSIGKHSSFIHIQQDQQQQSLLEPQTAQKWPEKVPQFELSTVKKELGKSSTHSRRLFEDTSAGTMNYQYSEGIHPFSARQSTYFDSKDVREQLYALKSFIEKAHDIKMEMCAGPPEVAVFVRSIEVESSKNEAVHLKNQNNKLREVVNQYRVQLLRAQEQLEKVRHFLLEGIEEEDFGPYASCQ